jgi:hypothetical protein
MGDAADDYGLFQIATPDMARQAGRISDLFQVIVSEAVPKDQVIIAYDPAPRRPVIDVEKIKAQFPDFERWAAKYVPQEINTNPKEKYTMDMAGIARMRNELEAMLGKLAGMVAVVERFGGEPADGTVIKFEHEFDTMGRSGETVYTYVAIRAGNRWYVSGRPLTGRAVKWSELLEFIGNGRAWIAETWREAPVPGATAESDEDTKAKVAALLANSSGRDTMEVAEELVNLLGKRD